MVVKKIKDNLIEYKRVYTVTHKPSMEEFKGIIKISLIGISIIGLLGFLVQIIWTLAT
ncbi:protein translocase SEC61 complex subunit gamma [Candidatus Woesearchaeota archaeon]|nr:protein translocase SEC61 complex subunit gamma [Candidatus Woesearchaeota archaeon]